MESRVVCTHREFTCFWGDYEMGTSRSISREDYDAVELVRGAERWINISVAVLHKCPIIAL